MLLWPIFFHIDLDVGLRLVFMESNVLESTELI